MTSNAPDPDGHVHSGRHANMEQRSKSMMAVDDPDFRREQVSDDRQTGKPAVTADESCGCPKPLTSIFDICGWCIQSKGGVSDYPADSEDSLTIEDVLTRLYLLQIPLERRPIPNRQIAKEFIPCRCGQRKAVRAEVGLYPRLKYLLRHLRERFAREIRQGGVGHRELISANLSCRFQTKTDVIR